MEQSLNPAETDFAGTKPIPQSLCVSGFGLAAGPLQAFEIGEGAVECALVGVDDAPEGSEEGFGHETAGEARLPEFFRVGDEEEDGLPELGGTFAKAAEGPLAVDEGAFVGGLALVVGVVVITEGFELGGIFSADEEGLDLDAGFEGLGALGGFAFGGGGVRSI